MSEGRGRRKKRIINGLSIPRSRSSSGFEKRRRTRRGIVPLQHPFTFALEEEEEEEEEKDIFFSSE